MTINQQQNDYKTSVTMNIVLNTLENALLKFGLNHKEFISGNVFQWLSQRLGYKAKNIVYSWIEQKECTKIGYKDMREIIRITKDNNLLQAVIEDLQRAANE